MTEDCPDCWAASGQGPAGPDGANHADGGSAGAMIGGAGNNPAPAFVGVNHGDISDPLFVGVPGRTRGNR